MYRSRFTQHVRIYKKQSHVKGRNENMALNPIHISAARFVVAVNRGPGDEQKAIQPRERGRKRERERERERGREREREREKVQ